MELSVLTLDLYANPALLLLAVLWLYGVKVFLKWRTKSLLQKVGKPDEILSDCALLVFIKGSILIFLVLIFIVFV